MTTVRIENIVKRYGKINALDGLSLTLKPGTMTAVLGPSGCGKTTMLRALGGFLPIDSGRIRFGDTDVSGLPPQDRGVALVFQNYALWPHMSVYDNVAYGLKLRKCSREERDRRVRKIVALVGLDSDALEKGRKPTQLSGGQQQRVALARALVIEPELLLLDEPLSNLDAKVRSRLRVYIREIQQKVGITALYVTHDQEEALAISDRIAVMKDGIIQQLGEPVDIYQHPENLFVATFIGQSNILDGKIAAKAGKHVLCLNTGSPDGADGRFYPVPELRAGVEEGMAVKVCVRPNEFSIGEKGFSAEAGSRVFFGDTMRYLFRLENGQDITVTSDIHAPIVEVGSRIDLSFNSRVINIFDAERGVSLMKNGISHE
jgi:iron(III) transport system ATP-binding protein